MRYTIIAVFLAFGFTAAPALAQAPQPAPSADTLAAARELVQVMKSTDQFKALLPSIMQALRPAFVQGRPEMGKDYDAIMPLVTASAAKRLGAFAEMMAQIYARNFTLDEIHDLTAFYRTPTGQKLIAQQPIIARESMAAGQEFGQELVADLRQQIEEQMRKREQAN